MSILDINSIIDNNSTEIIRFLSDKLEQVNKLMSNRLGGTISHTHFSSEDFIPLVEKLYNKFTCLKDNKLDLTANLKYITDFCKEYPQILSKLGIPDTQHPAAISTTLSVWNYMLECILLYIPKTFNVELNNIDYLFMSSNAFNVSERIHINNIETLSIMIATSSTSFESIYINKVNNYHFTCISDNVLTQYFADQIFNPNIKLIPNIAHIKNMYFDFARLKMSLYGNPVDRDVILNPYVPNLVSGPIIDAYSNIKNFSCDEITLIFTSTSILNIVNHERAASYNIKTTFDAELFLEQIMTCILIKNNKFNKLNIQIK